MKSRNIFLLLPLVVLAACTGAAEEPVVEAPAEPGAAVVMDDSAVLDELDEYLVTHYNMGHAGMVAELYTDDAVFLSADGGVQEGRDAIEASMEAGMAGQPTLALDVIDRVITTGTAVSHGVWSVELTPDGGEAVVSSGHFMTVQVKADGEWKTAGVVTNYDAPSDLPLDDSEPGEPPAETDESSPLSELTTFYERHYNMGHGGVVASRYAEDAMVSFANQPVSLGRDAVAAYLDAAIDELNTPQLDIHEVVAEDIGEGWILSGGWYELASSEGDSNGSYMLLARAGDDGAMQIHWMVSNGNPSTQ